MTSTICTFCSLSKISRAKEERKGVLTTPLQVFCVVLVALCVGTGVYASLSPRKNLFWYFAMHVGSYQWWPWCQKALYSLGRRIGFWFNFLQLVGHVTQLQIAGFCGIGCVSFLAVWGSKLLAWLGKIWVHGVRSINFRKKANVSDKPVGMCRVSPQGAHIFGVASCCCFPDNDWIHQRIQGPWAPKIK